MHQGQLSQSCGGLFPLNLWLSFALFNGSPLLPSFSTGCQKVLLEIEQ